MQPSQGLRWLSGITAFLLFGLLALPSTGWLIRAQLWAQVLPPYDLITLLRDLGVQEGLPDYKQNQTAQLRALHMAAERAPTDYPIQLTNALTAASSQEKVRNLRALLPRFPNRPSLIAHTLRLATMGEVHIHRPEEALLTGTTPLPSTGQPSSPAALEAFDRDAAEGERLDPDNAYFPLIRTVGLLEARRDTEALAALHRTATLPRFDDYASEETNAALSTAEHLHGRVPALQRMAIQSAVLFPHFASLRGVARMATYKAVLAEKAGRAEEGWQIRRDVMRCGSLMRVQSHPIIGSLVGIAMVSIARTRPGGIPPSPPGTMPPSPPGSTPPPAGPTAEQSDRQNVFRAYLTRIGHADQIPTVQAEYQADLRAHDILHQGVARKGIEQPLRRLSFWWILDLLVLANALRILLLGLAAAGLVRLRRTEGPLPPFVLFWLLLLFACFTPVADWSEAFTMLKQAIHNMVSPDNNTTFTARTLIFNLASSPGAVRAGALILVLLGPVATLLGVGIAGFLRHDVSLSALVRELRNTGVALGCLLLLYGGLALRTLQAEAEMNNHLEQEREYGGAYYARLLGQAWPR